MKKESDNAIRVPDNFSVEEAKQWLDEMGFVLVEDQEPWYIRIRCRIFGPHEWVPIRKLEAESLTEVGMACDICHKEQWW